MEQHAVLDLRHFHMPAEWHRHAGTLLTWPHRPAIWRGIHAEVELTFAKLAAELSEVESVHISVPDLAWQRRAEKLVVNAGANSSSLVWHFIDSDDVWARDHGPIFVVQRDRIHGDEPQLAMIDWDFNAWGGKFESKLDNLIPRRLNETLAVPRVQPGIVMEGGSLEVNGCGDLLTTEAVLLNTNRNPHLTRDQIEQSLTLHLGVERLHWLGSGLEGDDTDGHIDDIARFVAEDSIVIVSAPPGHADYAAMHQNQQRVRSFRDRQGRPFQVHVLPTPEPISFAGEHLPASYANFYIANEKVIVPTFDQASDVQALELIQSLLPDRRVVGLDGRSLVSQYGNFHCITQQIPEVAR